MKSRLTILAMLVAGILLSTTGAGLAVSGIAHGDTAQRSSTARPRADAAGRRPRRGGVRRRRRRLAPRRGGQPARQAEPADSGSQLPFTGYAAIPVLLGGVALLGGGLVLRARTRGDQS